MTQWVSKMPRYHFPVKKNKTAQLLAYKAFIFDHLTDYRNRKARHRYPGQSCCCSGCEFFFKLFIRSNFCCPNTIRVLCAVVEVCQVSSLNQSGALLNTCTPTHIVHVSADLDEDR